MGYDPAMVLYRRNRVANGTFFFTVTLRDRRSDALVRHVDALREAWRNARSRVPHQVLASVLLPDHLHAVMAMRDDASDYSRLWQEIKKGFTRRVGSHAGSPWQPRFWEHTIRDDADLHAHIDYVHINPLKHGLVERVVDWPHSSFHRYVREGILPADWGGTMEFTGRFGEP
ncbi:MAG TPA: transposase [Xanthomonadaceae bacterium]|nr:transposase [Xanthomonadaceae bacterium]